MTADGELPLDQAIGWTVRTKWPLNTFCVLKPGATNDISQGKDPVHHRRQPRHRPRHRAACRARRRQRRDRRQDHRAASRSSRARSTPPRRRSRRPAARRCRCCATSATRRRSLAAVAKTVATFGGIDICVNNASAISLTIARHRHEALRPDARASTRAARSWCRKTASRT